MMKKFLVCTVFAMFLLIGWLGCTSDPTPPLVPTIMTGDTLSVTDTNAVVKLLYTSKFSNTQSIGIVFSDIPQAPNYPRSRFVLLDNLDATTITLNNLTCASTYYYRVFATDGVNCIYGELKSFVTKFSLPTISTNSISGISENTAISGGTISENGGTTITARGVCWSTSPFPTVDLSTKTMDGRGNDSYRSSITGLSAHTQYYLRAYATNSAGTSYGEQLSFFSELQPLAEIGDKMEGGIVFYVDTTGRHGFVCAETNQSVSCSWTNGIMMSTSARSFSIGAGYTNTNLIVLLYGKGIYAARMCYDLVLEGYNDWYLPTTGELNLIFKNLVQRGMGNFPNSDKTIAYWSSTEETGTTAYLTDMRFDKGYSLCNSKNTRWNVRAIRSF